MSLIIKNDLIMDFPASYSPIPDNHTTKDTASYKPGCHGVYSLENNSFGEGDDTPLQYSCLQSPMDGGAW